MLAVEPREVALDDDRRVTTSRGRIVAEWLLEQDIDAVVASDERVVLVVVEHQLVAVVRHKGVTSNVPVEVPNHAENDAHVLETPENRRDEEVACLVPVNRCDKMHLLYPFCGDVNGQESLLVCLTSG